MREDTTRTAHSPHSSAEKSKRCAGANQARGACGRWCPLRCAKPDLLRSALRRAPLAAARAATRRAWGAVEKDVAVRDAREGGAARSIAPEGGRCARGVAASLATSTSSYSIVLLSSSRHGWALGCVALAGCGLRYTQIWLDPAHSDLAVPWGLL